MNDDPAPASDYSETFLDHYRRPRNLGDLPAPDAIAIVHEDQCGDLMRLAVALAPGAADTPSTERRIGAVRVKIYGCAAAVAVASVLSEMIRGKSLEDAGRLGPDDIVAALEGLPPRRVHAATLGHQALCEVLRRLRDDVVSRREPRDARE